MISRDPKIRETLAGEYVLGTLHGPARRRFERWLEQDTHLRALVQSWEQHLHPLAAGLEPVKPPARIWHAIRKRIERPAARPRLWDSLYLWRTLGLVTSVATAAALSLLVMVGVELIRYQRELAEERELTALVSHTDTRVAALAGVGPTAVRAAGWIVWSPEKKRGFIVVHFLPPLPAGQYYRLWVVAGEKRMPAGVFTVDHVGHNALTVTVEAEEPDGFEITPEPIGADPTPSGPVLMRNVG